MSILEDNLQQEQYLKTLFKIFYEKKYLFISIIISSLLLGLTISYFFPNYYKSEAVLSSQTNKLNSSSNVPNIAGGFSSLGIDIGSIGSSGNEDVDRALAISKSKSLLKNLIKKYDDILPSIMAPEKYIFSDDKLIFDNSKYDVDRKNWIRNVSPPKKKIPSFVEAHEEYLKIFKSRKNRLNGQVSMSVEHISPSFAKSFLERIILEMNLYGQKTDIEDAKNSIFFLEEKISQNTSVALKNSLSRLMEKQLQIEMLASSSDEYLLNVIDYPFLPEQKTFPNRLIFIFIGLLFGRLFSLIYAMFMIANLNKSRED